MLSFQPRGGGYRPGVPVDSKTDPLPAGRAGATRPRLPNARSSGAYRTEFVIDAANGLRATECLRKCATYQRLCRVRIAVAVRSRILEVTSPAVGYPGLCPAEGRGSRFCIMQPLWH
jgi:hypothetical protein